MSSDRFQFLEFGEDEDSAPGQPMWEDAPAPIQRELTGERLSDGTRLAEVRLTDPRGYRLSDHAEDDEEEGFTTLSSRAAPPPVKPPRLRVAEVLGARGAGQGSSGIRRGWPWTAAACCSSPTPLTTACSGSRLTAASP